MMSPTPLTPTPAQQLRAYLVHLYTASGVAFAFLAGAEICRREPDPRWVFIWLAVAVAIDATDGPLARACDVKFRAARFDGRKIDDIVDYLTFTFLPLLLVWRMDWLPPPGAAWVIPALIASLLGFANTSAKQESAGFFLGFPSYFNIYAFYAGPLYVYFGSHAPGILLALLTLLTILPVRFIYPNLAPPPWRPAILLGAGVWLLILLAMLPSYPHSPAWLVILSAVYPAFYTLLSFYLDFKERRESG
jgi:phosphatidylcholine synthase